MTKHAQEQAKDRKLLICLPVWKKLNKKKYQSSLLILMKFIHLSLYIYLLQFKIFKIIFLAKESIPPQKLLTESR